MDGWTVFPSWFYPVYPRLCSCCSRCHPPCLAGPDFFCRSFTFFSCLGDEFCETEMPFCSKGPATMPTSKPNEEVVAKLKACFWLLIELCFWDDNHIWPIRVWLFDVQQHYCTGLFRWALSDRGFLQGRQAASSKNVGVIMINLIFNGQMLIHSSHLAWIPFSSGSKRLPNWKGFQKRTWGEIFTVRRLACGSNISNIYWSIYYFDFLQAPCEFSFVDIGPSKSKGVDHTQASGFLCSAFGSRICQRNLLLDY